MVTEIQIDNSSPNQEFNVTLGEQSCVIRIRTLGDFMFISLDCNGINVFENIKCTVFQQLGYPSNDFSGALFFTDEEDNQDPIWTGLGERWFLYYVSKDDAVYTDLIKREVIKQWQVM